MQADDMDLENLKYVSGDPDHRGNPRWYFRRGKEKKIRLPPIGDRVAFLEAYKLAFAGKTKPKPDRKAPATEKSLRWYVIEFYKSPMFRETAASSKAARRRILDGLCEKHGHKPLALLEARHIRAWRDAKQETPDAANAQLKALRRLFAFANEYHEITANPVRDVPFLKSNNPSGLHSWTLEEVAQYEARHPIGTMARLAMSLMLYTVQRRSDVILMGRQHIKNGWIKFTQVKNQKRKPVTLEIPVIAELQRIIDATTCGDLTFLLNGHGRPFASSNAFGNWFRDRCDEAGLPQCSSHGLRKATSARLGELQCTVHEIMAITGHQTIKEVERYTKAASQKTMARNAMEKYGAGHSENESVSLLEPVAANETKSTRKQLKR